MSTIDPIPAPDGDDEQTRGPDLWRVAGALTVLGLLAIGAAILANRAAAPVRPVVLPADDLAAEYREGWHAGHAAALEEIAAREQVDVAPMAPLVVVPATVDDDPPPAAG